MKQRATVICQLGTQVLLVCRPHSRWALPGGRPKPGEGFAAAAVRELREETRLRALGLSYLFDFVGAATHHHVYVVKTSPDDVAVPSHEIARCRWFDVTEVAALDASVSTRGIIAALATPLAASTASGKAGRRRRLDAFNRNVSSAMQDIVETA